MESPSFLVKIGCRQWNSQNIELKQGLNLTNLMFPPILQRFYDLLQKQ